MANYLQLVKDLQREVGVAGAPISTVVGQSSMAGKLVAWIADADIAIQNLRTDWKFLWSDYTVNTVLGSAEPAVPADLNVWDTNSFYLDYSTANLRRLTEMPYDTWFHGRGRGVQTNSKPSYVVIKPDNQIVLSSTPDDVYALSAKYWKKPEEMTENTSESPIPSQFHRTIVVMAKLMYAEEQEMPDVYRAASFELYGDPRERERIGLIDQLKANQLPNQERRTMSHGAPIDIRPE